MLSLPDRASAEHAVSDLDRPLARLLLDRLKANAATGVEDLTHYLVVRPGDLEADIVSAIGFSPLVNPIDRVRFGDRAFNPWWDWLSYQDGWFEMIVTIGNSGFAFVLLIEDAEGADAGLIHLCRSFSDTPSCR